MMLKILLFIFFFDSAIKEVLGKSLWDDVSPNSNEIVGGHDVDIKQYPYQVGILMRDVGFNCGGSILSPDYILTAAHCLREEDPNIYKIRAGSSFYNTSGNIYDILSFILHEKYEFMVADYDVAIIKTEKMVINGVTTKAVQLAEAGSALEPGTTVVVTGWGRTALHGNFATVLQAVSMSVISLQRCREIWQESQISDRNFCVGSGKPGLAACNGDSGGPVVEESSLIQYGIVSRGGGSCNTTTAPDVHTLVPVVRDWIKEHSGI